MPIRIAIADDHPIVLSGLEQVLALEPDLEVVATVTDGHTALERVRDTRPDVLVLDLRMPEMTGLDVLRALRSSGSETRVVMLTAGVDEQELLEAVRLGARGVVLKDAPTPALLDCVRRVHAGERWLEGDSAELLHQAVVKESDAARTTGRLTARERDVVTMVVGGFRNRDIARHLGIAEGTVKIHLHNIYEKLRISGRVELVLFAREHGLA